jgi:hypothetical protein
LLLVADRAELRVQALEVGMNLVELSAVLTALEGEERGAIMLAFQYPFRCFDHANVGDAVVA